MNEPYQGIRFFFGFCFCFLFLFIFFFFLIDNIHCILMYMLICKYKDKCFSSTVSTLECDNL